MKEKLPQESAQLQKELNIMQNIAMEQHPTRSDLIVVQDKVNFIVFYYFSRLQIIYIIPRESKLDYFSLYVTDIIDQR